MNSDAPRGRGAASAIPVSAPGVRLRPLAASVQRVLAAGLSLGMGNVMAGELPVPRAALVSMGRADQVVTGNRMIVNQYTDRAVLNWESFNIGKDSAVQFKQPSAASVALNRIYQSDPSQILGNLSANGQVYLLNPNGIVFGKDSTVNVNTLVATSLNITDDTFERGFTKVLNQDGRAALTGTGQVYRRDAQGNFVLDDKGNRVKIGIEFEQGAQVNAGKSGRIIAAAPSVVNRGKLSAPDGQILMVAATDKVYLQETSGDPSLRGLVVEVATGGDVTNVGKLVAQRGNVTLLGFAVNQKGQVSASTAVQANGSVRLLAREGAVSRREGDKWLLQPGATTRREAADDGLGTRARVVLAEGSLTEATPDLKDTATAVDGQAQEASRVEIMGKQVRIEKDAVIRARAGKVSITATENPASPALPNVKNDSKVMIAPGATIDVSGIKNVNLPMARNVVEVELRSNELRDAPLQKSGPLYGKKIKVDIRKGTPLADIAGALDRIARTVAERSTGGGALSIVSEGDAVLAAGSKVDLSGGSVRYRSGFVQTSLLIGPDGRSLVDIGSASPDVRYLGLAEPLKHTYVGSNLSFTRDRVGPVSAGTFESGYVEGKSAGTLDIRAAALALDGEMQAIAVNGARQRAPELQAHGGTLSIDLARTTADNQAVRFGKKTGSGTPDEDGSLPTDPANPGQPLELVLDGSGLKRTGLQAIRINTNGRISVDQGHRVELAEAGALTLKGGEIAVDGQIRSLAGTVNLETRVIGGSRASGAISLGERASIDTSGGWNNDRPAASSGVNRYDGRPLRIDGGSVAVRAEGDVTVAAGSRIDVSGGANRRTDGTIKAGNAGSIALEAAAVGGSDLALAGNLMGYAVVGGRGGSLSLTSDQAVLGVDDTLFVDGGPVPLFLSNAFFGRGGFAAYTVASNKSGVSVGSGADIAVTVQNRILDPGAVSKVTGENLADFSQIATLPVQSRPAGSLSLVLSQTVGFGGKDAAVSIGDGATLRTDAGGRIGIRSDGSIRVNGTLSARAGDIDLQTVPPALTDPGFLANQGIWLGYGARLDASGASLTYQDAQRRYQGEVLQGGRIRLHADRGFIVADAGSTLDVAGTSDWLDIPGRVVNQSRVTERRQVASDAGSIDLQAAEGMQLFGDFRASGGSRNAAGGELTLALNPFTRNEPDQAGSGQPFPRVPSVIAITQSPSFEQLPPQQGGNIPQNQFGQARVSADQIDAGGFSTVTFRSPDRIDIIGDLSLAAQRSLNLDAPALAFRPASGASTGQVSLSAPQVSLGSTQTRPGALNPSQGGGNLWVDAGLIDLTGAMALQGFDSAYLNSRGDLRLTGVRTSQQQRDFLGEFTSAGDLTLAARQIYPTTLSDFKVSIRNNPLGTLSVTQNGKAGDTPLSVAGKLTLAAPNIVQGGTLRAPIGEIRLDAGNKLQLAAGSITSNSAGGKVLPFGRSQGGLDWVYPLGQQNLIFATPPEKRLSLKGDVIDIAMGSVIDTAGGGDLYAFEHVPGPGGSFDVLDPSSQGYRGSFAILPDYTGNAAPVDPLELPTSGLKIGDSLYLSGGGGLKAGQYILLPAHYALLPGAYLVTPAAGTQDLLPGMRQQDSNGATIVAGYRTVAGTDIRAPRWSGWAVETGAAVRARAEYADYRANRFYADKARELGHATPYLPQDAGAIQIAAGSGLNLDGAIDAATTRGGRGGRLDIAADNIAVVAQSQAAQTAGGAVQLIAEQLNALNVASISLGGLRSSRDDGVDLTVSANSIQLGRDAQLFGQEYILSARQDISLAQGAGITAAGGGSDAGGDRPVYRVQGDAAFLRVSGDRQVDLRREGAEGRSGSIQIEAGATVASTGALMLDASADNRIDGTLATDGGSVALGARRISLGEVDASASGLILDQARLDGLKADELVLSSGSDISLFGAAAVKANRLTLRTAALLGFDNAGREASLSAADTLRIDNQAGAVASRSGNGSGNLRLSARNLTLGEGRYAIGGFANVDLAASEAIAGDRAGSLGVAADLSLRAPLVTGGKGANTAIDASGHAVTIAGNGTAQAPANPALGARLAITADSIRHAGNIGLASGGVKLDALRGDLVLTGDARIDVAGRSARFGNTVIDTDGGTIELAAEAGNIAVASGARLALGGYRGGTLSVAVPAGNLSLDGALAAAGKQAGGRFLLDVGNAASVGDLGALGAGLKSAGFTDELAFRARDGDWRLAAGDSLAARLVAIAADRGGIRIDGDIAAAGAGATVRLTAADQLALGERAGLSAHGTVDRGGRVWLGAVDQDGDGQSGIELASGARVDVRDQAGGSNGEVRLRADRAGDDVAVSGNLQAAITGSRDTTVEAVRLHEREGTVTAEDIAGWKAETADYMTHAETIEARLGLPGGLLAGLEIRSRGDLALDTAGWDLADWRYGGRAGVLSLNAGGNLAIRGELSDGFRDADNGIDLTGILGPDAVMPVRDQLQTGASWSYRLAAGGDVVVGRNALVRTGTGDIDIAAGRDLVLSDASAAIYTAGRTTQNNRYGSFNNGFVAYNFFGEYPVEGGDIRIQAGRDVVGALTGQFFDGWFARVGNWSQDANHEGETPTAWSIGIGGPVGTTRPLSSFNQNVGALGGGDVVVEAGRDVRDLSVVLPTTGKQIGEAENTGRGSEANFRTNVVEVQGGGHLKVAAGGDVVGGTFYSGRGDAEIAAAGAIRASAANNGIGTVLALGDSRFALKAGDGIELGAAINPTVLHDARSRNYFFTYGADSGIELQALSGDVTLQNDIAGLIDAVNARRPAASQIKFPGVSQEALTVYPASLNVAALQGDIVFGQSFVTYPSAKADFSLLAGGDITTGRNGNNVNITQSDADPTLLPSVASPATSWEDAFQRLQPFGDANLIHARTPIHRGDTIPATLWAGGSIRSSDPLLFSLAEAANVQAGKDLLDVSFQIQHADYALSSIAAGRDIQFTSPRNAQGNLVNLTREIRLAGPGQLWVTAGRTIDLGASEGIYTIGNTNNSALAERGASVSILAGLGQQGARYDDFARQYDPLSPKYAADLTRYMQTRLGEADLDATAAATAYRDLPEADRREFLLTVLFREIRDASAAAARSGKVADYAPGYAAIEAMFPGAGKPGSAYAGDLKLFFSKVHTIDGGDINLVVPGGLVNAGLAVAFAGSKPASQLGIVAQREGAVNGLVNGDFQVNQSRVFAMDGGDITLWSSNGNIDAGRGAKAAIAAPPPIVTFDEQGNLKIEFPPVVSGSGIRTAASTVGRPGDVFLAAPKGIVDAGEAGIGGSNITIAATAVIGASNIDVGGSATGVPSANVAVPVAPAGAAAAASSATNTATATAEDAVNNDVNQANEKNDLAQRMAENAARLNPLQVDILGFGECGVADIKEGKPGCG